MRYGLPREEKRSKKWKNAVENELRYLQMEVCFLKEHLEEATKKLAEFTSSKPSGPFAFIQGSSRNESILPQFLQNVTNNLSSTNKYLPPFSIDYNGNDNSRFLSSRLQSTQGNPFASVGAERARYQSTWDYDTLTRKAVRFHSITCMPTYNDDKSFEELRYEDYVLKGIGFSNQIQRYKDSKLRSSRTEKNNFSFTPKNWKPHEKKHSEGPTNHGPFMVPWYLTPKLPKAPWPFGPSPKRNETSHSPVSENIASAATDGNIQSNLESEQSRSVPIFTFQRNSETKVYSDVGITTEGENLSSQVLVELRKMGENISSINDRLSKMDSNLSDISSRVSVMDSRLSAVDMFVTMQRFDKKWQGLETRLAGLETPSPEKCLTLPTDDMISKDTTHPLSRGTTLGESIEQKQKIVQFSSANGKNKSPQFAEFEDSGATPPKTNNNELESISTMDISNINLSDFVKSISCTDDSMDSKCLYASSLSDPSSMSDTSSKVKFEISSIEMIDLKTNSLPLKCAMLENLSSQENESKISYSDLVPSVPASISKNIESSTEKTGAKTGVMNNKNTEILEEPELPNNSCYKDCNSENKTSNPPEQKNSSSSLPYNLFMRDIESDTDNEFVIVETSDVVESLKENSKNKVMYSPIKLPGEEASSSNEFKICSDITEYLEINLGKKKNLVYEFGFEAKPDYSLESEGSTGYENKSAETQENKVGIHSGDDSFQQFKTNFIENKFVDVKQSSPFVVCDSKTSQESPGKNPFGKDF